MINIKDVMKNAWNVRALMFLIAFYAIIMKVSILKNQIIIILAIPKMK